MIVADANLIAALILSFDDNSETAKSILLNDRDWAAPRLWKSEFCNILATAIRRKVLNLELAIDAMEVAEKTMAGSEFEVSAVETLKTAAKSGCKAYDSEYVLLATKLNVPLITYDRKLLNRFPEVAIHPNEYEGLASV
jgi:predicted nucleic acid-binding protein